MLRVAAPTACTCFNRPAVDICVSDDRPQAGVLTLTILGRERAYMQARIQDFLKGGGMATRGGGVIGGDRPCRRKITI